MKQKNTKSSVLTKQIFCDNVNLTLSLTLSETMRLTIEKMNCGKKRMAEMTPRVKKLQENLETISDEGVFFERAVLLLEAERAHRNDPNDIKYVR